MGTRRILAVIPVRSGSKRFPGKNMALWGDGKDLTYNAVQKCVQSCEFDGILVVGDGGMVMAKSDMFQYVERPAYLVEDESPITDTLKWLDDCKRFSSYTDIALIQTTSPLFNAHELRQATRYCRSFDVINMVTLNPYTLREDGGMYLMSLALLRHNSYGLFDQSSLWLWTHSQSDYGLPTRPIGACLDIDTWEGYCIGLAIKGGRVK